MAISPTPIAFKQGTSFGANCVYTQDQGGPADLTGVTIQSAIRDAGYNYYPLTVTVTQNLSGHITWLLNMTLKEIVIQTTSYTTAALYGSNQNSWFAPYSGYDFGYLSATELLTP